LFERCHLRDKACFEHVIPGDPTDIILYIYY
jgi:hypothetical protein